MRCMMTGASVVYTCCRYSVGIIKQKKKWYDVARELDNTFQQEIEFHRGKTGRTSSYSSHSSKHHRSHTTSSTHRPHKSHRRIRQLDVEDLDDSEPDNDDIADFETNMVALRKLSIEDRKKCMEQKLCFTCQRPGHMASKCPNRPPSSKPSKPRHKHR